MKLVDSVLERKISLMLRRRSYDLLSNDVLVTITTDLETSNYFQVNIQVEDTIYEFMGKLDDMFV